MEGSGSRRGVGGGGHRTYRPQPTVVGGLPEGTRARPTEATTSLPQPRSYRTPRPQLPRSADSVGRRRWSSRVRTAGPVVEQRASASVVETPQAQADTSGCGGFDTLRRCAPFAAQPPKRSVGRAASAASVVETPQAEALRRVRPVGRAASAASVVETPQTKAVRRLWWFRHAQALRAVRCSTSETSPVVEQRAPASVVETPETHQRRSAQIPLWTRGSELGGHVGGGCPACQSPVVRPVTFGAPERGEESENA
jgi:hypothetical protein